MFTTLRHFIQQVNHPLLSEVDAKGETFTILVCCEFKDLEKNNVDSQANFIVNFWDNLLNVIQVDCLTSLWG